METFLGIIKPTEFQVPRFSLEGKQGENDRCIIVGAKHMAFVRVLLVSAGVNSSHFSWTQVPHSWHVLVDETQSKYKGNGEDNGYDGGDGGDGDDGDDDEGDEDVQDDENDYAIVIHITTIIVILWITMMIIAKTIIIITVLIISIVVLGDHSYQYHIIIVIIGRRRSRRRNIITATGSND